MLLSRALRLEPGQELHPRGAGPRRVRPGRARARRRSASRPSSRECPDNDYAHYALGRCLPSSGVGERRGPTCGWPCALARSERARTGEALEARWLKPAAVSAPAPRAGTVSRRRGTAGEHGRPRVPARSRRGAAGAGGGAMGQEPRRPGGPRAPVPAGATPAVRHGRRGRRGPALSASGPACAIASRMAMRFWIGGCVSKRPAGSLVFLPSADWRCRDAPWRGWRAQRLAGRRRSSLSARARPSGLRVSSHAGGVGEVLALARDGELDRVRGERRQDREHDGDDHEDGAGVAARAAVSRLPAEAAQEAPAQEEVGDEGDHARRGCRPASRSGCRSCARATSRGRCTPCSSSRSMQPQEPAGDGDRGVLAGRGRWRRRWAPGPR